MTEIIDIAIYRKAKLLIEENKLDEAHNVSWEVMPDNYQHNELKGDIFYLENNFEDAFIHYNKVLTCDTLLQMNEKILIAKINFINE